MRGRDLIMTAVVVVVAMVFPYSSGWSLGLLLTLGSSFVVDLEFDLTIVKQAK